MQGKKVVGSWYTERIRNCKLRKKKDAYTQLLRQNAPKRYTGNLNLNNATCEMHEGFKYFSQLNGLKCWNLVGNQQYRAVTDSMAGFGALWKHPIRKHSACGYQVTPETSRFSHKGNHLPSALHSAPSPAPQSQRNNPPTHSVTTCSYPLSPMCKYRAVQLAKQEGVDGLVLSKTRVKWRSLQVLKCIQMNKENSTRSRARDISV